jgi:hypothetical protein
LEQEILAVPLTQMLDALTGTRTLLVLDNLETLTDADQRSLFAFLGHLPRTCKALLTSRPLVIATGRRLKLQQLDQTAALKTLADIARDNPALDAAPESDRLRLITETGGNTLLLTWTAWQVGSGSFTTIADALAHLRSCPQGKWSPPVHLRRPPRLFHPRGGTHRRHPQLPHRTHPRPSAGPSPSHFLFAGADFKLQNFR